MSRLQRRLATAFVRARREGRAAFMPFLVAGDPSLETTLAFLRGYERAGADIIEVGFPYSDPLADGPVIQRANQRSLVSGTTVDGILEVIARFRATSEIPLVAMIASSLIEPVGGPAFCTRAADAGFDGIIVPDLPEESVRPFLGASVPLDVVLLVAPTTPADRRTRIAKASRGFLYVVSLTGVTGAHLGEVDAIRALLDAVRAAAPGCPPALGFGIATPADAEAAARMADGVIVGSALVQVAESGDPQRLEAAARELAEAVHGARRPIRRPGTGAAGSAGAS